MKRIVKVGSEGTVDLSTVVSIRKTPTGVQMMTTNGFFLDFDCSDEEAVELIGRYEAWGNRNMEYLAAPEPLHLWREKAIESAWLDRERVIVGENMKEMAADGAMMGGRDDLKQGVVLAVYSMEDKYPNLEKGFFAFDSIGGEWGVFEYDSQSFHGVSGDYTVGKHFDSEGMCYWDFVGGENKLICKLTHWIPLPEILIKKLG